MRIFLMFRIENDVERLQAYNPYNTITELELDDVICKFVTLIWLIKDKKLTKTTFFIEIFENDIIREIFKTICGCDTDIELYRELLIRYPSVSESKFIKNRIKKSGKV
jgi:hypothetical protein